MSLSQKEHWRESHFQKLNQRWILSKATSRFDKMLLSEYRVLTHNFDYASPQILECARPSAIPRSNAQKFKCACSAPRAHARVLHTSGLSSLRYECFCARTQFAPRWSQKVLGCPPRPAEVTKRHFRAHGGLLTIFSKIHFLTCLSHILSQGK